MTDQHRTDLLIACAFCRAFLKYADAELRGAVPDERIESAMQLKVALKRLEE